ncbi:hypothetical protein CBS147353_10659 [Aspergillus niger]|nr:hypothetical protein CBS147353_10659 [Aspergillus niger]
MAFNRIAVYGHRGWASSAIVAALIATGAPVKVLYRPGSDVSALPDSVAKVAVNLESDGENETLIAALQDIDIVISLVGHGGVTLQHALVKAIPRTKVKLFVPSDLAARYDEQGLRVPVNRAKLEVENAARAAGIPVTVVLPGNFAEFALNTPAMGVDRRNNRVLFIGNSEHEALNLCTRPYVAAAYASLFASTSLDHLCNRSIALSELRATGAEIAQCLTEQHGGSLTRTGYESLESINQVVEEALATGSPFALAFYCRKIWASGEQCGMVRHDAWDVRGYKKATLRGLLAQGELGEYRQLPPAVLGFFEDGVERYT